MSVYSLPPFQRRLTSSDAGMPQYSQNNERLTGGGAMSKLPNCGKALRLDVLPLITARCGHVANISARLIGRGGKPLFSRADNSPVAKDHRFENQFYDQSSGRETSAKFDIRSVTSNPVLKHHARALLWISTGVDLLRLRCLCEVQSGFGAVVQQPMKAGTCSGRAKHVRNGHHKGVTSRCQPSC